MFWFCFFFFQAEDGIRDIGVTGVQTCALPIYGRLRRDGAADLRQRLVRQDDLSAPGIDHGDADRKRAEHGVQELALPVDLRERSEEHTSELQSRQYLVCRLLLEKKKKNITKKR